MTDESSSEHVNDRFEIDEMNAEDNENEEYLAQQQLEQLLEQQYEEKHTELKQKPCIVFDFNDESEGSEKIYLLISVVIS